MNNNNDDNNNNDNLKELARKLHDSPILWAPTLITYASFHFLILLQFPFLGTFHVLRYSIILRLKIFR